MAAATLAVHAQKGFFTQGGGYEFPFVLGVGALTAAFSGGGRWSSDRVLEWQLAGEAWGLAAAIGGLMAAAVVVGSRGLRLPRLAGGRTPRRSGATA